MLNAQEVAAVSPNGGKKVGLIEVLKIALNNNPSIKLRTEIAASNDGGVQIESSSFDPDVTASVGARKTKTPLFHSTAPSQTKNSLTSSVTLSKKFRNGITVSPTISVSRLRSDTQEKLFYGAESRGAVDLALNLPLLKGSSEDAVTSNETAARHTALASQYDLRHQIATAVRDTANAYWAFRYAEDVLKARRKSEDRAAQLGEDMRRLIAADERPAADINLTLANLTEKRVIRISAEQSLRTARQSLGDIMGVDFEVIQTVTGTLDDFPHLDKAPPQVNATAALIALARDNRWDVKAAAERSKSADILMIGAKDGLQSQMDMDFTLGYSGLHEGTGPSQAFGRSNNGFNFGATLTYNIPVGRNSANGTLRQTGATLNQHRINQRTLRRSIGSGVDSAISAYNHATLQLLEAQKAVDLYTTTVQNKSHELKLGQATLIDLITVEDQLQAAIISFLSQSSNFATAIINLQFETGRLIDDNQDISINQFLTYDVPLGAARLSK
ncbi:MAG: TolC family protein [Phycisphaeraceae bacterium]|nr:TolC family protein [Phycisphaeraceae bacterium]